MIHILMIIGLLTLALSQAIAAMPESEYRASLQVAERQVLKKYSNLNSSGSLSTSILKNLYGRFYQVGDQWDVAAWNFKNSAMRKMDLAQDSTKKIDLQGIFRYEVVATRSGSEPEVDIKVTQLNPDELGLPELSHFKPVDPRVSDLRLTLKVDSRNQLVQAHKTYTFLDAQPANINHQTILELFPLDIPEIIDKDQLPSASHPLLPSEIEEAAKKLGFQLKLTESVEFHQDDFFGRPVEVIWQRRDPWPSYLRTVNGISILLRKGSS